MISKVKLSLIKRNIIVLNKETNMALLTMRSLPTQVPRMLEATVMLSHLNIYYIGVIGDIFKIKSSILN